MSLEVLVKEGRSLPLVEKSGIQSTLVVVMFQGENCGQSIGLTGNAKLVCQVRFPFEHRTKFEQDKNLDYFSKPYFILQLFTFPLGKRGITSDDYVEIVVYTFRTDARGNPQFPPQGYWTGQISRGVTARNPNPDSRTQT
eukprot:sb/3474310/